ncbi:hypothetical protein BCR34DRAFT_582467 [Clohesyomyces aquaticus]|uniref:Uncharacterized protein n=1 Tax=Clohesyomyces aquaticus TaxID=1231657 RepID=A0A1Y2AAH9_9PLEO|nr:hypothetical protein BCR34DRAFT_582467 [Clohesyomyces aquaticus]
MMSYVHFHDPSGPRVMFCATPEFPTVQHNLVRPKPRSMSGPQPARMEGHSKASSTSLMRDTLKLLVRYMVTGTVLRIVEPATQGTVAAPETAKVVATGLHAQGSASPAQTATLRTANPLLDQVGLIAGAITEINVADQSPKLLELELVHGMKTVGRRHLSNRLPGARTGDVYTSVRAGGTQSMSARVM